jgi:hypothetical protein
VNKRVKEQASKGMREQNNERVREEEARKRMGE